MYIITMQEIIAICQDINARLRTSVLHINRLWLSFIFWTSGFFSEIQITWRLWGCWRCTLSAGKEMSERCDITNTMKCMTESHSLWGQIVCGSQCHKNTALNCSCWVKSFRKFCFIFWKVSKSDIMWCLTIQIQHLICRCKNNQHLCIWVVSLWIIFYEYKCDYAFMNIYTVIQKFASSKVRFIYFTRNENKQGDIKTTVKHL